MADLLPQPYGFSQNLSLQKCTISAASSGINQGLSEPINSAGKALVGLIMPAAWTAAAIQYYASITPNQDDFKVCKDTTTGNFLQTLVVADDWVVFPLSDAIFAPYIKLKSVTAGGVNAVTQGAAREIYLLFRNFLD